MKCEKCGAEMNYFQEYSSCGWRCPACGWGLATTYTDPINQDETSYVIYLQPTVSPSADAVRTVAHLCGCNFIAAKEILASGKAILEDKAATILKAAKKLLRSNLEFTISPEFSYPITREGDGDEQ